MNIYAVKCFFQVTSASYRRNGTKKATQMGDLMENYSDTEEGGVSEDFSTVF